MNYAHTLSKLVDRHNLAYAEMHELISAIMQGQLTPAQISAVLIALRIKGETVDEITAAAKVMRELSTKVNVKPGAHLIDTCGTGGDGEHTLNISTASAFVASAAGAQVAKHGCRSVSSTCGSADILEKLGVNVNLTPEQVAQCVNQIGIGFMFAPHHHSSMKHAAPVRRELGVRTLFNLLGPLTNPAGATNQVIGVFHRDLPFKIARVLQQLGSRHVMVVHGADGMDEISISGGTHIAELSRGEISEYTVQPQDFGLDVSPLNSIQVANSDEAHDMILAVLNNQPSAARNIVQLNAGAAIYVAGLCDTLPAGIKKADESIASGAAKRNWNNLSG